MQASATYSYDPLMQLSAIDSSNAAIDTLIGYDGQDIALEDLGGGKRRRYVHGPWSDEPLMSSLISGAGTFRDYYHADERGSIVAISDSTGTAGTAGKYDEYGAGTGVSHFHYTGQYWLVDANLHYYKARVYDARLGRFLQADPIGYGAGMNMYAYVNGDPVNFTDPTGLCGIGEVSVAVDRTSRGEGDVVALYRLFCQRLVFDAGGAGGGGNGVGFGDNGGGVSGEPPKLECKLGGGAIDVTFDGTTLNITANITLMGPGANTSSAYIAGIDNAWTKSYDTINSIANISAGPGGVIAEISSGIIPSGGPRSVLGGNHMWLGNLGAMNSRQMAYATQHVGAHEFGHSFGIENKPSEGKWVGSIMANSANDVSSTDLEAVVELCRTAQ